MCCLTLPHKQLTLLQHTLTHTHSFQGEGRTRCDYAAPGTLPWHLASASVCRMNIFIIIVAIFMFTSLFCCMPHSHTHSHAYTRLCIYQIEVLGISIRFICTRLFSSYAKLCFDGQSTRAKQQQPPDGRRGSSDQRRRSVRLQCKH